MRNKNLSQTVKASAFALSSLMLIAGCSTSQDQATHAAAEQQKTIEQTLIDGSPWATTALYQVNNGQVDKTTNYIDDSAISKGTISSAQYRDGQFMFIGMQDYNTGEFDQLSLVSAINSAANDNAKPSGFAFGDYAIFNDGQGNDIRRLTNASFAPTAVINRTVTIADSKEFGYVFTAANGHTYYVEHKPYALAFSDKTYPSELATAVDNFFRAKFTLTKQADYNLRKGSPWATTAIYLQVNGQADTSVNYINDAAISQGTISSAQYRNGQFLFVGMNDFTTGEFDHVALVDSLVAVSNDEANPQGFAKGDYQLLLNEQGQVTRRITKASFAPTATIDRVVTEATENKFTYTFSKNGETYYVEHLNYADAFKGQTYPQTLQTAIDAFFAGQ